MPSDFTQVIPMIRTFNVEKARGFYLVRTQDFIELFFVAAEC